MGKASKMEELELKELVKIVHEHTAGDGDFALKVAKLQRSWAARYERRKLVYINWRGKRSGKTKSSRVRAAVQRAGGTDGDAPGGAGL